MGKQTDKEIILRRLEDARSARPVKDAAYRLRRFLAGDESAIGGDKMSVKYDSHNRVMRSNRDYPDFSISYFEEGVSNHTLSWIRNLVMQIQVQVPEISFPDLTASLQQLRESYLRDRLSKAGWLPQQETVIYNLLVDGYGIVKIGIESGMPTFRAVDLMSLYYDVHTKYPDQFRYVAQLLRISVGRAKEEFGDDIIGLILPGKNKISDEDIVQLIEYWDNDTLAYVSADFTKVLRQEDNQTGMIPFEFMHGPILPSMTSPLPHILNVIGSQTAHTELQRSMLEIFKRLRPIIEIDQSSYDEESVEEFLNDPDNVSVLVRNGGEGSGIQVINFSQLTSEMLAIKNDQEKEIVRHLGVNPFAAGASVDPEFSSEVAAIQGAAGLNAQYLSQRLSDFLGRVFRKMIRLGFLFDDQEFIYSLQGETVEFGRGFTIEPVLRDDVVTQVSPGSVETEFMKRAKNQQLLGQLNADPVMAGNLALRREIWSRILEADNMRNIDTLITQTDDDRKLALLQGITSEQVEAIMQQLAAQQQENVEGQPN